MHKDDRAEDDRVSLKGLDPVAALKALLRVDPDAPPADAADPPAGRRDPEQRVDKDKPPPGPAESDDAK